MQSPRSVKWAGSNRQARGFVPAVESCRAKMDVWGELGSSGLRACSRRMKSPRFGEFGTYLGGQGPAGSELEACISMEVGGLGWEAKLVHGRPKMDPLWPEDDRLPIWAERHRKTGRQMVKIRWRSHRVKTESTGSPGRARGSWWPGWRLKKADVSVTWAQAKTTPF